MCKKVCEAYFLHAKGQHVRGQKMLRVGDTPIPYVCAKDIPQGSHKYHSASISDCRDSWHAIATTESILPTFCFNSRWINQGQQEMKQQTMTGK